MSSYANQQPFGFKNEIENIAIVGAGGNVGKWITSELLKTGKHKVTAITREDSKTKLPEGLHGVKKVNYDDKTSLTNALKGQQALILTITATSPQAQAKFLEAAKEAGVKLLVPNEWGT